MDRVHQVYYYSLQSFAEKLKKQTFIFVLLWLDNIGTFVQMILKLIQGSTHLETKMNLG